jgi:hypothetical protein
MTSRRRQSPQLEKRPMAFVLAAALASLMLASAEPAQAKRILGTNGPDTIVGTARADVIMSLGGDDRIKGRGGKDRLVGGPGRDRLLGGRGADHLNAVDGRRDRVIRGGPGKDVCRVDAADRANMKGCETVTIIMTTAPALPGAPGSPGSPGAPGAPGAPGTPGGSAGSCASPPEDADAAQDDPPPTFSDPFYAATVTLNGSTDGLNGDELPISIEVVCDVPQALLGEAAQLVGGDGVAIIGPGTQVFDATGQQLTGEAGTTALAGADTVSLEAQLERPARWRQDEDGQPVPTFSTSRADITD